jgi:hypothetical protein
MADCRLPIFDFQYLLVNSPVAKLRVDEGFTLQSAIGN